jgi:hypothetical protein
MAGMTSLPRPLASPPILEYAWTSTHLGHELIAAGMLIMATGRKAEPLDYGALERWTRVGYERGTRSRQGER